MSLPSRPDGSHFTSLHSARHRALHSIAVCTLSSSAPLQAMQQQRNGRHSHRDFPFALSRGTGKFPTPVRGQ